jgi:hypothetical protein
MPRHQALRLLLRICIPQNGHSKSSSTKQADKPLHALAASQNFFELIVLMSRGRCVQKTLILRPYLTGMCSSACMRTQTPISRLAEHFQAAMWSEPMHAHMAARLMNFSSVPPLDIPAVT